jgi:RNA-directed DNA polymerase
MSGQRQKIQCEQLLLAFVADREGEAPTPATQGTEPLVAKPELERPAANVSLMEEVSQRENLEKAWRRVRANKGSPGVDGMTIDEFPGYLREHWPAIEAKLLSGTYTPQPVRRMEIPKPGGGGVRKLGIPTVCDRWVQQAVLQVLQKQWDPTFSEHSYGFRPNRSAHQAVKQAQCYIAEGFRWVVDLDLEKFFDQVNHDILMGLVAKRVSDKRLLKLIRACLNAGVLENGLFCSTERGTPQGGPLSPLLSNLMLDVLDRELERRGHRFVRYADDSNIYVCSRRAGQRVMQSVTSFVTRRLKLKVNAHKSAVARPWQRSFLGFSFTSGKQPKRRVAPKSIARFKQRARELTRRTVGVSMPQRISRLAVYLRGWRSYYGYCQTPSVLEALDSWVRRRLRAATWKQWKRIRTRYKRLRQRGVSPTKARRCAFSSDGPWRLSAGPALCIAFPNAYFDSLGLPRLATGGTA